MPGMSAQSAMDCFNENIKLFANPQIEPEKYNLYRGLGELADAIKRLEYQISVIKGTVEAIDRKVIRP
jgi:hypothetical protein